jgi:hypothetical protein
MKDKYKATDKPPVRRGVNGESGKIRVLRLTPGFPSLNLPVAA